MTNRTAEIETLEWCAALIDMAAAGDCPAETHATLSDIRVTIRARAETIKQAEEKF